MREVIEQYLGKDISDQIIGKEGKTCLKTSKLLGNPLKADDRYLIVYVVNAKPFEKLGRLVELFAVQEFRNIMLKKQKETQFAIIKEIYNTHKDAMQLLDADGKAMPIPEKVLEMLGHNT